MFLGACTTPSLTIVQEFCTKGSLYDVLNDKKESLGWDFIFKVSEDILKGLGTLHNYQPPMLHRNLKSSNVMVKRFFNLFNSENRKN